MRTEKLALDETECFSPLFIDYINQKEDLKKFYRAFPTVEAFKETIANRNFSDSHRKVLVNVLERQYQDVTISERVSGNIRKLEKDRTFTVVTGHQLNILTGPLYFIYKIVTIINACKVLKKTYPGDEFVPVYWMASEDHDFKEINHFHFNGKKYRWETDQKGAVGRFDPADIQGLLNQLPEGARFFKKAYSAQTLAEAGRRYVNHLFGDEGVIVMDADDADLKRCFNHVIEDDLFSHHVQQASAKDTEAIKALGYKTQVNAREVNFFYLHENMRERLEHSGEGFQVVDTDICFSESEIRDLVRTNPERFSPNVILRPLYQETILPNLAYVGGPSETVYWLQLKSVFAHFNTPFPLLMPRNFALVIPSPEAKKWRKTGLTFTDLFLDTHVAFSKWVKDHANQDLSFDKELDTLNQLYDEMGQKASAIDPTLTQHIEALKSGLNGNIEKAAKKLLRAEKRKHAEKQAQIEAVKQVLFPRGSLQEREDNFLNFYLENPNFIKDLIQTFDAFDYRMYLLLP